MRKRWLVLSMATLMAMSLTACGGDDSATVESSQVIETEYSDDTGSSDVLDPIESTEDITEAAVESQENGLVKVSDIKDDTLSKSVTQAQSGLKQLAITAGYGELDPNILTNRDYLFETLGITQDDLVKLKTQEELVEYLQTKGLTEDQMYCYSIYMYLLDALDKGDDSTDENMKDFLTKTKDLLALNELDFNVLINTRGFSELKTAVEASGLSLYDLNCKLWINDIFPGVDVDATALMEASSPEEFLKVFTDAEIKLDDLSTKAAEPDKAKELLDTLKTIEKESIEAEENKGSSGGSGSGGSGSGSSKEDIKESLADKEQETIPDKGGENTVTVVIGNEGSSTNIPDSNNGSTGTNTTGNASISVGNQDEKVKIIVKKILWDEDALSEISASNANLPGNVNIDNTPDDYQWVAVKFSVKGTGTTSDVTNLRPIVRVKNMSGGNIEDVSTRVFYIEPESTSDDKDYVTYWVAFMIPDNQSKFMLYFGETSGSVYKFKSTALDED